MAVQLKKRVAEELMKKYGLEIDNVQVSINDTSNQTFPDNLKKVSVLLKQPDNKVDTVEAVQPIEINSDKPLPSNKTADQTQKVAAFLSQQWNVNENTIDVSIEGGDNGTNG